MQRDTYGFETSKVAEWRSYQERTKRLQAIGQKRRAEAFEKYGIKAEIVNIFSEATRMTGTLWTPKGSPSPSNKFPAILLCHGLGGIRSHLDARFARDFCLAGFICLTFDYRGWSDSDGVVAQEDSQESSSLQNDARQSDFQEQVPVSSEVKVRVIRQSIDMVWQIADIDAAFNYLTTISSIDIKRIGIWGTSQGGGHVVMHAGLDSGRDIKVAAVVSQAPSLGRNGFGNVMSQELRAKALLNAQNESKLGIKGTPSGVKDNHLPGVDGVPVLRRLQIYDPLALSSRVQVPTLIIDVDKEELYAREENGLALFKSLSGVLDQKNVQYELLSGVHYDVYEKLYDKTSTLAIEFFLKHLKPASAL